MNYVYGLGNTPLEQIATPAISAVATGAAEDAVGTSSSLTATLSGTNFTATKANDQILVAVSEDAGGNASISGFTTVGTYSNSSGEELQVFRQTAPAGVSSVVVNFTSDIHAKSVVAVVYRGVDPYNPVDTSTGLAGGTAASVTVPSITTTQADDVLVMAQGALNGLLSGLWTASSMAERVQENQSQSAAAFADETLGTAGATGSQTASYSGSTGTISGALVALRPAQPLYYLTDQLGSVRAVITQGSQVVASYTYNSYGVPYAPVGSATVIGANPFGFAGAYTDLESGLLYLVHRFYDPTTGQVLTTDPLIDMTSQPYSYTADDPINGTDPAGDLCLSWSCIKNDVRTVVHSRAFKISALVVGGVAVVATGGAAFFAETGLAAGLGTVADLATSASFLLDSATCVGASGAAQ